MIHRLPGRLIALGVVIVLGFFYILFDVFGWRVGAQSYPVTVQLARAGGIYPRADVTYRGVSVGRVTALDLEPSSVAVRLAIDPGTKIPADSTAAVKQLTAAGEQYLDLVPGAPGGGDLKSGAVISGPRTSVPVSIGTTIDDFGTLLSSIRLGDLNTVETFLANGLGGTDQQLRAIITDTKNLTSALSAAEPSTVTLVNDSQPVLTTFDNTDAQFAQFTTELNALSAQLAASNKDLSGVLTNGAVGTPQFAAVLTADNASIQSLVNSSSTLAETSALRSPAVQALFQILPVVSGRLATTASGGTVNGELLFNAGEPVCPYVSAAAVAQPTQPTAGPSLTNGCSTSGTNLLQRGAQTAPGPAGG